jgi:hypothetical protein
MSEEVKTDPLGKRLVYALLNEKNPSILTLAGVTENDIFGDGREAYAWSLKFLSETGDWPTPRILEENLGMVLPEYEEKLEYIADLVRKRSLGNVLHRELRASAELLDRREPDAALKHLTSVALKHSGGRRGGAVSYRASGPDRIEAYKSIKEHGIPGVPTPWDTLDLMIQGWCNGTLNVVMAMQNTGKSWFICITAEHCLRLKKKALVVTMEMPVSRIQRRIDSIRHKIPFKLLRDTSLDLISEDRWMDMLTEDVSGDGDIILADKKLVKRVSDVTALVLEHRPDIVLIDGGYRFDGKQPGQWESTVEIVGELQTSAEMTNIPWVVTTQMGDSNETGKTGKKGVPGSSMRAWNVRYGKEWVINPDVVIGMYQDNDLRLMKEMVLVLLKMRDSAGEGIFNDFRIKWDQGIMDFAEVPRVAGEVVVDSTMEVSY